MTYEEIVVDGCACPTSGDWVINESCIKTDFSCDVCPNDIIIGTAGRLITSDSNYTFNDLLIDRTVSFGYSLEFDDDTTWGGCS